MPLSKNLQRHYTGCYRAHLRNGIEFAQILRAVKRDDGSYQQQTDGREWLVEIRDIKTGALIRFAGVFPSLKTAFEDTGAPKYR